MKRKEPVVPATRQTTVRRQIQELLNEESLCARDISAAVGIAEKEVYGHLEHIRHSIQRTAGRLRVSPSRCHGCGFVFVKRRRLTRPSRCPVCRSESISEPIFSLK